MLPWLPIIFKYKFTALYCNYFITAVPMDTKCSGQTRGHERLRKSILSSEWGPGS